MAYTFKHGDRPLDGYTIQRAVGRGGFGEVYYAISDGGREVAIKYLRDNPQVELRGVSNCINLKSPHLVSIFDVRQTTDGDYAIIMEYCSGPSLRDLLVAEPNGFAPEKAAFFAREIGKGLSYLHERGIVHRDLKPGNIFFDDGYVKIGDYGLSKFISVSRHSAQTASVGTVHYMAPEIGSGDYSRGIDIYALGVMLFEMLRGTVPFEGSTMAEILMKHLTSQPEVDHLPEPFGRVIRKALEKDPRNRYATVDEMMEELLAVDTIKQSLAGFSVKSLEGAVARGGAGMPSPMPSPNPTPHFAGRRPDFAAGSLPLPDRVARKIDQAGRKIENKMARMAHKRGIRAPQGSSGQTDGHGSNPFTQQRWKRIVLSVVMAAGLSVALGIISGANTRVETGAAAGMLIPLMAISVGLAGKAVPWFGATYGPKWAQYMIRIGCAAPLLAIGASPVMASRDAEEGFGLWLGLLAVAVLGNWNRAFENARDGEVSFWGAVWTGFGAVVATAIGIGIMDRNPEPYIFIAAGVAFSVSLIVQASTWWAGMDGFKPAMTAGIPAERAMQGAAQTPAAAGPAPAQGLPPYARPFQGHQANQMYETMQATMQHAMHRAPTGAPQTGDAYDPRLRWDVTRGFWSVVSFLLMAGAIICFLLTLILDDLSYDDRTGTILGCIACAAMFTFAVRKTTPVKKETFWRETARPFFLGVTMFGIGGTTTGIARYWFGMPTEERVMVIVGLVFSSLWFLFLFFARGKRRATKPFLNGSHGHANAWLDQQKDQHADQTPNEKGDHAEPAGPSVNDAHDADPAEWKSGAGTRDDSDEDDSAHAAAAQR